MNDYIRAHIRTLIPMAVGYIVTLLAKRYSIIIPEDATADIIAGATSAVSAIYYALVRAVAEKWGWAGWLLGVNKAPTYQGK